MARELQMVSGEITAKNERGVKLGDTWYNLSRWADQVDDHEVGDRVELGLDSKGFVRTLTRLSQGQSNNQQSQSQRGSQTERSISSEWVRVQALTLALQYAQLAKIDQYTQLTLLDIYELADEIEGAIRHGFPAPLPPRHAGE